MSTLAFTRRDFLKSSSALVIGFSLRGTDLLALNPEQPQINPLNAWIRIAKDNSVTLILAKSEMGQGVTTSLPMILAEELDIPWASVKVEQALTDPEVYSHGTGGSGSVAGSYEPLRQAGAAAREMLISAAAKTWDTSRESCHVKDGAVYHGARTLKLTYGELVETASKLPIPDLKTVVLKNSNTFDIIGKSMPRLDIPGKVNGSAVFGLDVRVPGMLRAVIARCPYYDGKVKSFDAAKAKAVPGVVAVVEVASFRGSHSKSGIAVVANNTWAAMQGRNALVVEWEGANPDDSTDALSQRLNGASTQQGKAMRTEGDVNAAFASAATKIDAVYELPFLAHATMEPMNCTADVRADRAELWAPTQSPDWIQGMVAGATGLPRKSVVVHTTLMGGGFGRRYQTDFGVEAALVSRAVGKPVQVVWTREDDMAHDFYRPTCCHRLSAAFDASGKPSGWRHHICSTSIRAFWGGKPEQQEVSGAAEVPYAVPAILVEYAPVDSKIPRAWWRSVENSFNGFAVESFIDEVAAQMKKDPVQLRLELLAGDRKIKNVMWPTNEPLETPRLRAVLQEAATRSDWGKPLPKGRARGVACFYSFDTYVAQVAEVSVENGDVKVHRVTCAVDCGRVINPDGVKAQMESAIIYGLSAALYGEITVKDGAVQQSNFHDYQVARIGDAPHMEIYLMPSTAAPKGVGEPGVPCLAPAVTNALFALTGKRVRKLPIKLST
ncbi:MAG TPA: xanthine dehydrogenase family protein molybdopterin-binding subunit [Candidatus Angelobacter sp.]|nr:xanthine dehydrogenase family protein molybdopterin-binding subunit [Candidatus Angelobacter sp.]